MRPLEQICTQYEMQFIKHFFIPSLDEDDRQNLRTTSSKLKSLIPRAIIIHKYSPSFSNHSYWLSSTGRIHSEIESYEEPHLYKPFSEIDVKLQSGVKQFLASGRTACAALKTNGEVVTWGLKHAGGDSSNVAQDLLEGVKKIDDWDSRGMLALKENGQLIVWGYRSEQFPNSMKNNIYDFSSEKNAAILKQNRRDVIILDNDKFLDQKDDCEQHLAFFSNVIKIEASTTPTNSGFVFLLENGEIHIWGKPGRCRDMEGKWEILLNELRSNRFSDVVNVSGYAFIALKNNGSAMSWGYKGFGGDVNTHLEPNENIKKMIVTSNGVALLKYDGSVFSYGRNYVNENETPLSVKSNVKNLIQHPRNKYFKAVKTNGEIIKWHWKNPM